MLIKGWWTAPRHHSWHLSCQPQSEGRGGAAEGKNQSKIENHHNPSKVDSLTSSNGHSVFLGDIEARLLLLYTGKPRLAKNLLQNVVGRSIQKHTYSIHGMSFQIRNWYGGDSDLVETFKENHRLAGECWTKVTFELQ